MVQRKWGPEGGPPFAHQGAERRGEKEDSELLFEFRRIGASVKVSVIDPKSGKEVSIVGPASLGEKALAEQAAKKLRYVLQRAPRPPGRA